MRSKFVAPDASIHYYVVEFDPSKLSWADFRGACYVCLNRLNTYFLSILYEGKVLGPTDPKDAPEGDLLHSTALHTLTAFLCRFPPWWHPKELGFPRSFSSA